MAGVKGRSGGKRPGAGRKPMTPAERLLRGTWRPDRHGPRPPIIPTPSTPTPVADAAAEPSTPPPHLSPTAAAWWRHVVAGWAPDHHHLLLLRLACEALDQAEAARAVVAREGLTVPTADGSVRAHPCLAAATAARAQFASLVAQLDLDVQPAGGGYGRTATGL